MPRYYFHVEAESVELDVDGRELSGDAAAREQAAGEARDAVAETGAAASFHWRLIVMREDNSRLLSVELVRERREARAAA